LFQASNDIYTALQYSVHKQCKRYSLFIERSMHVCIADITLAIQLVLRDVACGGRVGCNASIERLMYTGSNTSQLGSLVGYK